MELLLSYIHKLHVLYAYSKRTEVLSAGVHVTLLIVNVARDNVFFGLVRIRPLRSDLTISEPWDEGDGFE